MSKKQFGATAHLITITNCKSQYPQQVVVDRIKSLIPSYKSLVIACERHGRGDLHYHIFGHWAKKWTFRKTTWKPVRDFLSASNDDYKAWSSITGITRKQWLVEKWRYCNNLATAAFTHSKGDKKGQIWVYNDGERYDSEQEAATVDLKPDADVLNKFINGQTLTQQYSSSDVTRMAYMAKNWDVLTKMITNHKRIMREISNEKPKFTKEDFNTVPSAELHDFSKKVLVLQGKPNGGKTQYAKTFFKKPLIVRHPDKLKSYDENTHDGIIFDDQSYGHWPRESVIHLFDVEEEADINVKNSMVTIPAGVPRIFTTNRLMRVVDRHETYGEKHLTDKSFLPARLDHTDNAIDRRMTLIECGDLKKASTRVAGDSNRMRVESPIGNTGNSSQILDAVPYVLPLEATVTN